MRIRVSAPLQATAARHLHIPQLPARPRGLNRLPLSWTFQSDNKGQTACSCRVPRKGAPALGHLVQLIAHGSTLNSSAWTACLVKSSTSQQQRVQNLARYLSNPVSPSSLTKSYHQKVLNRKESPPPARPAGSQGPAPRPTQRPAALRLGRAWAAGPLHRLGHALQLHRGGGRGGLVHELHVSARQLLLAEAVRLHAAACPRWPLNTA